MTTPPKRSIPFGPQFSPKQTPLLELLDILARESGEYTRLCKAIRDAFFNAGSATEYNRLKKADNTILALRDYGVLAEDKATLTAFGQRMVALRDTPEQLYAEFGRHILLNLNGLAFVRTVQDLFASRREISLATLPRALSLRGVDVPPTVTHLSAMKGWLRLAGVFEGGRNSYAVNEQRLEQLLGGLSSDDLDAIADLNLLQRFFLRALARFPQNEWSKSNDVARVAENLYGVQFPWKSIASSVLEKCRDVGFVEYRKTTGGRGAKPHLVRPTPKFATDVLEPILARYSDQIGSRLRELFRTPIARIVEDLEHRSKHVKGRALELLALYFMFSLDLQFVDWRKRGLETGGAEVDVVVESARLVFSRWQIQCKNGKATLEDVAKEVGLAYHLNSNVVIVLSTKRVTQDAIAFADSIMRKSNLQVIVLHEPHFRRIVRSPDQIVDTLMEHSRHTMQVKRSTLMEVHGEASA